MGYDTKTLPQLVNELRIACNEVLQEDILWITDDSVMTEMSFFYVEHRHSRTLLKHDVFKEGKKK